jgi:hypothetical protein
MNATTAAVSKAARRVTVPLIGPSFGGNQPKLGTFQSV